MPDKKLTDNEIKKALECCANCESCDYETTDCPLGEEMECRSLLAEYSLDLIKRIQAKVEGLELELADTKRDLQIVLDNSISAKLPHCVLCGKGAILTKSLKEYDELISDISAEAVTEFAERLISIGEKRAIKCDESPCAYVTLDDIRTLLKECEDKK